MLNVISNVIAIILSAGIGSVFTLYVMGVAIGMRLDETDRITDKEMVRQLNTLAKRYK